MDSRHFKFYAFAGLNGAIRWQSKNEVSILFMKYLWENLSQSRETTCLPLTKYLEIAHSLLELLICLLSRLCTIACPQGVEFLTDDSLIV